MKRLYYIYKLKFPNNKIYIGQTVDLTRRFYSYRKLKCEGQIKLYELLKFYEWDLIHIEILYFNITTQEDIDNREEVFIQSVPEDLRLNIKVFVNSFSPKKGKYSLLSKPIYQINKNLEIIKEWNCLSEIKEFFHNNVQNISKVINNESYFAYGFYWCHKSKYTKDFQPIRIKIVKNKKTIQLNKRGVFIKDFNSLEEAAKSVNGLTTNIHEVCKGRKSSAYNYIWAYEEDYKKEDYKIRGNLKKSKKSINV